MLWNVKLKRGLWHCGIVAYVEYAIYFSDFTYSYQICSWWASCKWLRLFCFLFLFSLLDFKNEMNITCFENVMKFQDKETNQTSASHSLFCFKVKFLNCLSKHSHDCSTTSQLSIYKNEGEWLLLLWILNSHLHTISCEFGIIIIIIIYYNMHAKCIGRYSVLGTGYQSMIKHIRFSFISILK